MHCIKLLSFCFHLFLFSATVSVAVASPTSHNRIKHAVNGTTHEPILDLCLERDRSTSKPDIRSLENRGYCHYKVCEDKYGDKNGRTRNPDIIYRIVCEKTANCTQVYLPVEVKFYDNGFLSETFNRSLPAGCVYSVTDLTDSITVEETTPNHVS
jgi:hypothetical protein